MISRQYFAAQYRYSFQVFHFDQTATYTVIIDSRIDNITEEVKQVARMRRKRLKEDVLKWLNPGYPITWKYLLLAFSLSKSAPCSNLQFGTNIFMATVTTLTTSIGTEWEPPASTTANKFGAKIIYMGHDYLRRHTLVKFWKTPSNDLRYVARKPVHFVQSFFKN